MKVVVIMNTTSGTLSSPEHRQTFLGALRDVGLDTAVIIISEGGDITAALQHHLDNDCQTVVAAGGDGTVSIVASMIVGTGISLGVIPGGTLNHFAADLHIPFDLIQAVNVLKSGVTKRVDVGTVNGHVFLNNSGLGLYPEMVMKREEIRKHGVRKATALLIASALTLVRFPLLKMRVEVNGKSVEHRTPFVFVGNNPYDVDGARFGRRSRIDTGRLCLWVARRDHRLSLLRAIFQMTLKGLQGVRELEVVTASEAVITARRKYVPVSIDGEVFKLRTPLKYGIRPGALSVIVPAAGEPQ